MDIIFERPKIEPTFQAEIYRSRQGNGREEYRVLIGAYGTESPPTVGTFIDSYAISDFMNRRDVARWVRRKVAELEQKGKNVKFDESPSYLMAGALEELAAESSRHLSQGF